MEIMTMDKKYLNKLSRIIVILFSVLLITACDKIFDFDQDENSDEYTDFSDDERKDTKPTSAITKDDSKKEDTGVTGKDDRDGKKDNEDDKSDSDSVKKEPEITKEPEVTETLEDRAESAMKALTSKLEERYANFENNKANVWVNFSKEVYYSYNPDEYFINNISWRTKYNWNNYDQIMQFLYSFVDLDNDGINELITCELTDLGTDFDNSRFSIYKWQNNNVITMLDDSACVGTGLYIFDNLWRYSFKFSHDYSYLLIEHDEEYIIYNLNKEKYDKYAKTVPGESYVIYFENGAEKNGNNQQFNECRDLIETNPAQLNMSVYEYMENPFTPKEQANLLLSDEF